MNIATSFDGLFDSDLKTAQQKTLEMIKPKFPEIMEVCRMAQSVFFRTSHHNPNEIAASVGVLEKTEVAVKKANAEEGKRIQGYIDELQGQLMKLHPISDERNEAK